MMTGFEAIASGEGLYERCPGLIALLFTILVMFSLKAIHKASTSR